MKKDGKEFIKGGYMGTHIVKNIIISIEVYWENTRYVFIDWYEQVVTKRYFASVHETLNYITAKYVL